MACPATIWMVMLFPMEATCWKKMTAQYPDAPAQAAQQLQALHSHLRSCCRAHERRCLGKELLC